MPLAKNSRILCDFRGVPFAGAPARARDSRGMPARADAFAKAVLEEFSRSAKKSSLAEILRPRWHECVGKKYAGKCALQSARADTVFVFAPSAQTKQAMAFDAKKIVEKIAKIEGCQNIKKMRFV